MSPRNNPLKLLPLLLGLLFMALPKAQAQFGGDPILNLQNEDLKLLNWGYYLGMNQYDFQFEYRDDTGRDVLVDKGIGFNVGLIGELRLNEFLDVRTEPGLLYTSRILGFPGFSNTVDAMREVKSTYIRFPLLLKAGTRRIGNWKPFIIGGIYAAINLGSKEDSLDDNSTGEFRDEFAQASEDFVKLAKDAKVTTEATAIAAAVESMTDDAAVVLVTVSSTVTNADGAKDAPRNWRLSVDLRRDGDQIKMAKVEFVP